MSLRPCRKIGIAYLSPCWYCVTTLGQFQGQSNKETPCRNTPFRPPPEPCPPKARKPPTLITVADAIDQTRYLIIAASNLSAEKMDSYSEGLHAVIIAAEEKLDSARAMLAAIRGQEREATNV
jgi:hypothetical protein